MTVSHPLVVAFINVDYRGAPYLCIISEPKNPNVKNLKTLEYQIEIAAPRKKVWDTMLDQKTYREWTGVSWPGSLYEGQWKQGENIRFVSDNGSGTLANLVEVKPNEFVSARHIAILKPGGIEDRDSEVAKGWIGILEEYTFTERHGNTTLKVVIKTNPQWEEMLNEGWPGALKKLKEICE